jgi:methylmalonyl-CoA mutase N-terminal domain/subunit
MLLRFHTQTGGSTLTAQQPENNIVRTTIEALAGVLGGTQSLHTNAFDEALALPTEKSAEIALRTQQIIAHESGAAGTVDPMAGSYYIEYLTAQIEKRIREIMADIERRGGSVKCVESGWFKQEIANAAYDFQRRVEKHEAIIVGVNDYVSESMEIPSILKVDPNLEKNQVKALRELRSARDTKKVDNHLRAIREACEKDANVVYPVVDAIADYVTVGEIANVFRDVWGEYNESL